MSAQYFAQIDENNVCRYVCVVSKEFLDENPDRYPGIWVETFCETPGKTYAAQGYIYDYSTQNFSAPIYE
jgi:hypothetical protein